MIDSADAQALADENEMEYIETSAKTGSNVARVFEGLAEKVMANWSDKHEETVKIAEKMDEEQERRRKNICGKL